MDTEALQKFLTKLISQSPIGEMFKGVASYSDGQMHLVLTGDGDEIDLDQLKELIGTLSKTASADGSGQPPFDIESLGPNVVTIVVNSHGGGDSGRSRGEACTLRNAIDREWPW